MIEIRFSGPRLFVGDAEQYRVSQGSRIPAHGADILGCARSQNERWILCYDRDGEFWLWDLKADPRARSRFIVRCEEWFQGMAVSDAGSVAIVAGRAMRLLRPPLYDTCAYSGTPFTAAIDLVSWFGEDSVHVSNEWCLWMFGRNSLSQWTWEQDDS